MELVLRACSKIVFYLRRASTDLIQSRGSFVKNQSYQDCEDVEQNVIKRVDSVPAQRGAMREQTARFMRNRTAGHATHQ
jgi:hypothetical protein